MSTRKLSWSSKRKNSERRSSIRNRLLSSFSFKSSRRNQRSESKSSNLKRGSFLKDGRLDLTSVLAKVEPKPSPKKEKKFEENVTWEDFLAETREGILQARNQIKFHFQVDVDGDIQQAFPGCSMTEVEENLSCAPNFDGIDIQLENQSFGMSDARLNRVRRGPNYKRTKQKAQSGLPIYDLVSLDVFESEKKIYDFSDYIEFPQVQNEECALPEFLVVNTMVPTYKPPNPLFHARKSDGVGVNVVHIFKLSSWAKNNPNDSAVKLVGEFMNVCAEFRQTNNPKLRETVNRLKNIIVVLNHKNIGFSMFEMKLFPKYNKTPWLIRYFLTNYKLSDNFFEIDIDYHKFKYTTLQLGHLIFSKVKKTIVDSAIVIEGRSDEEMPERVLCQMRAFFMKLEGSPKIEMTSLDKEWSRNSARMSNASNLRFSKEADISKLLIVEADRKKTLNPQIVALLLSVGAMCFAVIISVLLHLVLEK